MLISTMEIQLVKSIAIFLLLGFFTNSCQARARRNQPVCNDDQQKQMQEEFQECLNKYTKEHHESSGIAETPEQYQKFTCKLLSDTVECGELWKRCHSDEEVRNIQDTHIQARIGQFRDNNEGIDVLKCPVVEEYLNSGRQDRVDQSTEGACSVAEVSEVQTEFQECSHNISTKLYDDIQSLEEGRFSRDTNDLAEELNREDSGDDSLDPLKDIKPRCCIALGSIAKDCIESFNKCFSREDAEQIKRQHIQQMQQYYEKIYSSVGDLSDCPQLQFLNEEPIYDDEEYDNDDDDNEEYDDGDDYEPEYTYEDTEAVEEKPPPVPSSATSEAHGGLDLMTSEPEDEIIPHYSDPEENAVIGGQAPHIEASSRAASNVLNGLNLSLFLVLCFCLL